ncbi:MAG: hypothetical protein KDD98_10300 [Sphingomonadaceae bacterium]|nr:hypothetical protein [Sphingomonadaceae bacterium]
MTADPRDGISGFTEYSKIRVMDMLAQLWSAVGWGTLAGAIMLTVFIVISAWPDSAELILTAFIVAFLIVGLFNIAGMLLIGLPLTALLKALRFEKAGLYAAFGALAGFAIIAITFEAYRLLSLESLLLTCSGAVAGAACAWRWGRWRESWYRNADADAQTGPHPADSET